MITMGARVKKRKDSSEKDLTTSMQSKAEEQMGGHLRDSQRSIKSLKSGDFNNTNNFENRQSNSKALLGNSQNEQKSTRRNHAQNHSPHKSASFVKEASTALMNSDSAQQIQPSHTPASSSFTVHAQAEKAIHTS